MKRKAVDFSVYPPRILTGYEGEETDFIRINPNLKAVKDLPPHMWRLSNGAVVPCHLDEAPLKAETYTPIRIQTIHHAYQWPKWAIALHFAQVLGLLYLLSR